MTTPINRTPSQRQSMSPRNSPLGERTSVSPLHPIHGTTSNGNQQAAKLRRRASSALEGMALHVHARDSAYRQSLAKPPTLYGPSSHLSPTRQRILFYHKQDPHYGFTNFSPHPVMYNGLEYPTSEHLFQSFKFQGHRPQIAERIRVCSPRPSVAFEEARKFQPEVRRDWFRVNIEMMDEALWHKFAQHDDLKRELLATGDAELVEDSDKDPFWGIGADKKGRNELGKALERLRDNLRNSGVTVKVCDYCKQKPRHGHHRFCGRTCANAAKAQLQSPSRSTPSQSSTATSQSHANNTAMALCINCHQKPKYGQYEYCGRTCASTAANRVASGGGLANGTCQVVSALALSVSHGVVSLQVISSS